MRRKFTLVLILALLAGILTGCSGSSGRIDNTNIKLKYIISDSHTKNNKLYIDGGFYNMSSDYHITSLEGLDIVITDKSGNALRRIDLNNSFARNCFISANGGIAYNFSTALDGLHVNSAWELRYELDGSFGYEECAGANCSCRKSSGSQQAQSHSSSSLECSKCRGTGACPECNGSGRNNATGVLAAFGCTLCDKSGKCCYCNGKGWIEQ